MLFTLICLSFCFGCQKTKDNPGRHAPTYQNSEYYEDHFVALYENEIEVGEINSKRGSNTKLKEHILRVKGDKTLKEKVLGAVERKIEKINRYLKKYSGHFRIRYSDGNLELKLLKADEIEYILKEKSLYESVRVELKSPNSPGL